MDKDFFVRVFVVLVVFMFVAPLLVNFFSVSGGSVSGGVKRLVVRGVGYGFSPDRLVVDKGDVVSLSLVSLDVSYDLVLPEFGVNLSVPPGGVDSVEFVASESGEFVFRCVFYCEGGARGVLVVRG